jgi:hypothetical protein
MVDVNSAGLAFCFRADRSSPVLWDLRALTFSMFRRVVELIALTPLGDRV